VRRPDALTGMGDGERTSMKKTLASIVVASIISLTVAAMAAETTSAYINAITLLRICRSPDLTLQGECIGYIKGVSDRLDDAPPEQRKVCAPPGITAGQLRDVVVRFLRRQTRTWQNNSGSSIVDVALRSAFPCKSN
jgi:hypothetical protein